MADNLAQRLKAWPLYGSCRSAFLAGHVLAEAGYTLQLTGTQCSRNNMLRKFKCPIHSAHDNQLKMQVSVSAVNCNSREAGHWPVSRASESS